MNIITEAELPDDITQLKLMVIDLSRRLQNSHYILQSEKQIKDQLYQQNEYYKCQMKQLTQSFSLEFSRMKSFEWKTIQEHESLAYERRKASHSRNVEQLRLMELDNQMSGRKKFVPKNILKLRASVVEMERQQENQRRFLSFLTHFQQLNEHLISAIQQNDGAQVLQLLQQGADVNYVDSVGYLPLHYAVIYGHYDLCQLLLLRGADFSTFLTGHSSVVFACQYGHVSILSLLLSFGADVNEKDRSGVSPVMMALTHLHFHVMEFCIMNGADVHDYDLSTENTLLHTLVLTSSQPASTPSDTALSHPLHSLQTRRPVTAPALSLPATSSPSSSSNEVVVTQIFDFLIRHGCDLYKLNKQQLTPLQLALELQNRHCIDLLKPHYSHYLATPQLDSEGKEVANTVRGVRRSEVVKSERGENRMSRRQTASSISVSLQKKIGGSGRGGGGKTDQREEVKEVVGEGGGDGTDSVVKPRLSAMPSEDNLAIPPPSATNTTSWSSMNLLDKINENYDRRDRQTVRERETGETEVAVEVAVEGGLGVGLGLGVVAEKRSVVLPSDMMSVASSVTFD